MCVQHQPSCKTVSAAVTSIALHGVMNDAAVLACVRDGLCASKHVYGAAGRNGSPESAALTSQVQVHPAQLAAWESRISWIQTSWRLPRHGVLKSSAKVSLWVLCNITLKWHLQTQLPTGHSSRAWQMLLLDCSNMFLRQCEPVVENWHNRVQSAAQGMQYMHVSCNVTCFVRVSAVQQRSDSHTSKKSTWANCLSCLLPSLHFVSVCRTPWWHVSKLPWSHFDAGHGLLQTQKGINNICC